MAYGEEFAKHWPRLLGACIAVSFGVTLHGYTASIFGPAMLREFGWSKAEFAFAGAFTFMTVAFTPIAGRLVDTYGYRVAGAIGFVAMSLAYLSLSLMTGDIRQYYAIVMLKNVLGVLTTSMVFSRVVVERFNSGRGLALAIPASSSPLVGSLAVLVVGEILAAHGWRAGYRALALACLVAGACALLLCGRDQRAANGDRTSRPFDLRDVAGVFKNRSALLLIAGMFLVNIPQTVMSSQLGILLADKGASKGFIVWLVSLYPIGVMIGRFSTGLMLDAWRPHLVALGMLVLPAVGLAVLATDANAQWILTPTILMIGVAQGAEGDVGAYLASRKFDLRHYSFVLSLIFAAVGLGTSTGALVLGYSLSISDSFSTFLLISVAATLAGAACFFATGAHSDPLASAPRDEPASAS